MKFILCFSLLFVLVASVEITPKTLTREIKADVLRDFPGVCYASTQCRTFKENEEWDLKPFCGKSICIKGADGILKERVSDCGPPAKANPECKVNANATLPYPNCCPVYDCAPGVQLEFPDIPVA
ncbi:U-scoloptoxin(16)-Cw1a-like [Daphnia pulex]|uniref:Single domain-containing protein n=1 Tax=Daphnia pulex TaxID=6669 RepID=E9GZN8_DAPPU|nr:U-scoloptoxin(16)-Cw1a-like [Daphnia pulex]XP_046648630.1 U-scoloptoxin(16)-Cw1a-like [Daphnia pulicaria]EFX75025.1 hypothetical protein DAPPUDRAFT_214640 [Daphnia pulex]|eukprot:EFX75025.1 hypothetical protein DAPPUDRAFT_214640 [Daphnia pulex]